MQGFNLLGWRLREARGNRSGREIAKEAGISAPYYFSLEKGLNPQTGKPHQPSREIALSLASALGIDSEELVGIAASVDLERSEYGAISYPRALLKATIAAFRQAELRERDHAAKKLRETGSLEGVADLLDSSAAYRNTASELREILEGFEQRIMPDTNTFQDQRDLHL